MHTALVFVKPLLPQPLLGVHVPAVFAALADIIVHLVIASPILEQPVDKLPFLVDHRTILTATLIKAEMAAIIGIPISKIEIVVREVDPVVLISLIGVVHPHGIKFRGFADHLHEQPLLLHVFRPAVRPVSL